MPSPVANCQQPDKATNVGYLLVAVAIRTGAEQDNGHCQGLGKHSATVCSDADIHYSDCYKVSSQLWMMNMIIAAYETSEQSVWQCISYLIVSTANEPGLVGM